ncbi:acetyl-CoA synthetase-like protein [Daldinia caldariorum]|uniref:acetyl-CoA synthetase-like protein n=1 Tax=Daldinia caldariorum TaxID=326644 RepID=UPI002008820D|nr:acetyl-CoA synthetase-like protein [Daldinia caldariorum]KAI1468060.1 acetyl-CoA synthetase-like protein [Daldinia caldariorum]
MVLESRWTVPIPNCSVQKWVFRSCFDTLPDEPQFIDVDHPETHFITQSGFRLWSKRLALGLIRAGLKPGDRVLLFSGNSLFTPVIFMGIQMAGGVFTGANPSFVPRELAYQLKDSGASFLIAADASIEIAIEAAEVAGLSRSQIYSFDTSALDNRLGKARLGTRHWTSLLAPEGDAAKFDWIEPANSKTALCALNYSSGTTGVPKGVEITHFSYVANGLGVNQMERLDPEYDEKKKRYRRLGFLPMYHAYGQTFFICIYPKEGVPVYIMSSFNFEKMLQCIEKFRIDSLTSVPPIIVMLAKSPLSRKYDISSLESITSGAAPLGAEVGEEVSKLWPEGALTLRQGWGMTELTCASTGWHPKMPGRSAAVGELLANCKARIMRIDGSGEITRANERGEIWITGPTLLKGYWKKPEATADTLHVDPDGTRWLKTGDVGFVEKYEPGGLLHIVDRIKELIKVKGNQVAPAELEAVLLENKGVRDAAVVGVTINGEELPRAYIVPDPEVKPTEQEIVQWMESKVVNYKRLKGGVKFIEAIPKNPSGKILRKVLRDQAANEVGDRKPSMTKLA